MTDEQKERLILVFDAYCNGLEVFKGSDMNRGYFRTQLIPIDFDYLLKIVMCNAPFEIRSNINF